MNLAMRTLGEEARHDRMDALMRWWPYTDGSLRQTVEALIEDALADRWSDAEERQFLACAEATWAPRCATRAFRDQQEALVWEWVLATTLPTTQVLLRRIAAREEVMSLERVMRSPLADFALHEAERTELQLLLPQLEARLWKEYQPAIRELLPEWEARRVERQRAAQQEGSPAAKSAYEQAMIFALSDTAASSV
jgi:hypothetical protein